ncbi:MAG TPA: Hsp20/alpha crystallin family protein [Bacteroidia bacterium]|jgi:HSP20 family protein|nr:Hsp20/alpha crystallin family protein [Bacteroidia bacterium]
MTLLKDNGTSLFPALTDFFETEKWISPEKIFRGFHASLPAANVSETGNEYKIELAVPGFKKEEMKVSLENEVLTISAENKIEKEEKTKKFTRKEFSYGSFTRSFQLPKAVNSEKIEAKYENGLLKLGIPKKEEAIHKAKKEIKIA